MGPLLGSHFGEGKGSRNRSKSRVCSVLRNAVTIQHGVIVAPVRLVMVWYKPRIWKGNPAFQMLGAGYGEGNRQQTLLVGILTKKSQKT